jgi:hypothetical protein
MNHFRCTIGRLFFDVNHAATSPRPSGLASSILAANVSPVFIAEMTGPSPGRRLTTGFTPYEVLGETERDVCG